MIEHIALPTYINCLSNIQQPGGGYQFESNRHENEHFCRIEYTCLSCPLGSEKKHWLADQLKNITH